MWAHYASSHNGFVVEFDANHEFFTPSDFFEVQYSATRPRYFDREDWKPILITKSPEWEYEAEFRLVKPLAALKPDSIDGVEMHFAELPLSAVKRVFLGCRMNPAHAK